MMQIKEFSFLKAQWGQLKQLKNLHNDNAVAQYLLSCYVNLSAQQCQSTQKESPETPVTFKDTEDESSSNSSILRLVWHIK